MSIVLFIVTGCLSIALGIILFVASLFIKKEKLQYDMFGYVLVFLAIGFCMVVGALITNSILV